MTPHTQGFAEGRADAVRLRPRKWLVLRNGCRVRVGGPLPSENEDPGREWCEGYSDGYEAKKAVRA